MLKITGLNAGYDGIPVVHDISMEVNKNETVALIGLNGAGKSTILKSVASIIRSYTGKIEFCGEVINDLPPHVMVQRGISVVLERRRIFGSLSVEDNLLLGAYTVRQAASKAGRLKEIYDMFPRLSERKHQRSDTLSGGERQILTIARGLMSCPKLLLIDEAFWGLDPIMTDRIMTVVRYVNSVGVSVVIADQKIRDALRIADRGYILRNGSISAEGPARLLLSREDTLKGYMGI